MDDQELFAALGFHWDRAQAQQPVTVSTVSEVIATFERDMAGHVWAAAALEGNPFTYPEVKTLLEGITVGGRKVSDAEQILRLRDAYVILRNLVIDGDFRLTKEVSDRIHDAIARGEALEAGHFRGEGTLLTPVAVNLGEYGSHVPLATERGGGNLREIYRSGLAALDSMESAFERGCAYSLFAADHQFYFDGNKRTARSMMNGVLMSAGVSAVQVPAQAREEFNAAMVDFHVQRDGTRVMELFASCGPRVEPTRQRWAAINEAARGH